MINLIQNNNKINFQGRVQMPPEKLIIKMIKEIDVFGYKQKQLARELVQREQRSEFDNKKSLFQNFKEMFFSRKTKVSEIKPEKTLKDFWRESLGEMKNLVEHKLPDEYVLRIRKGDSRFINFRITRGKEYICGYSGSIVSPLNPLSCVKKYVEIISHPDYKSKFNDFKQIIPDLTENIFVMHNKNFIQPRILKWVEANKILNEEARLKKLQVKLSLQNEEFGQYNKIQGVIKDKNDKQIYNSTFEFKNFRRIHEILVDTITNEMLSKIKDA